jgi:hypothetical protein
MMAAATLRLSRRWGGTGNDREWGMEIDGSVVGSIAYRQTVELPIEPGHHTLRLSGGGHVSPLRSFDTADGDVVSFRCRSALVWPVMVAALVKPDLWISLKLE